MNEEAGLLRAIAEDPADPAGWLVLGDWLDEQGDARGELLRAHRRILAAPWGEAAEEDQLRVRALLNEGVRPAMPRCTNSLGMEFVLVPPGVFWMGEREGANRYDDEVPAHEVAITRPFWLGACAVMQEQYRRVTRRQGSAFRAGGARQDHVVGLDTSSFPVENASWEEAVDFCERLGRRRGEEKEGRRYRLATEAEWEYACRAGSSLPFHFAALLSEDLANFDNETPDPQGVSGCGLGRPCPVGSYPPNAWGLFDMHGNVWEWCSDWFDREYYQHSPREDPRGPEEGETRQFRGGAWCSNAQLCRACTRSADGPDFRADYLGFRVVLEVFGE